MVFVTGLWGMGRNKVIGHSLYAPWHSAFSLRSPALIVPIPSAAEFILQDWEWDLKQH